MKLLSILLSLLFPLVLIGQNISNPYFSNFYIDVCPNDTLLLTQLIEDWDVYKTFNNEWDGEIDSTCVNIREENNRAFIDLVEFDISKPLFVRSAIDEANKILLDSNAIYSVNANFNVSLGLQMDISDQCAGGLCSGLITSFQIPDEAGTGFNHRINKTSVQDLGSCDASLCMATEDFEENYLREFILKIKVDESSETEDAWIRLGGAGIQQNWEIAKIWDINVGEIYFDGTSYEMPFEDVLGDWWWSNTALLRYHDGDYPNSSNLSYNEVKPIPNKTEPQTINLYFYEFYFLQVQPFTSLIGGFVEGSDSVRHTVNVINEGDFCLGLIIDLIFEGDTHFVHAGGHVDLGAQSCMMFRNNGSLKVQKDETFQYGQNGIGLLALQEGGTIVIEENATLIIDNQLVIFEQDLDDGPQQIYMELNPTSKLVFGPNATITNEYSLNDQMKLNIYMNGGEVDDHHLSPSDRALINKIYPTPSPVLNDNLKLYPNPISNDLRIEYLSDKDDFIKIQLLSMNGNVLKLVDRPVVNGFNELYFSMKDLPGGMYFIQLSNTVDQTILKIVKS